MKMVNQPCAICEKNDFDVLYHPNFNPNLIDEKIFSARRLPDKIHYQIVKCRKCNLIYSNPILPYEKIEKLYKKSCVTYEKHHDNLKKTYGYYLRELEKYQNKKDRLLDVGCGNGFFLETALDQGYKKVFGVEPGKLSVAKARKDIKKNIIVNIFRPDLFKPNFFDAVCCFQTFDHIPDPNSFLKEVYRILKKGGLILFLNHDAQSWNMQLLGERSPIIDIEHTYLYDKKTIVKILKKFGFKVLEAKSAYNIHNISYWTYLFPLPKPIKVFFIKVLELSGIGK
jgi:SAM-dependent methyltransferase